MDEQQTKTADLLAPRELIHGCYVVERCIGRGGMGQVFLARDTHLDRRVAIKVTNAEFAENPDILSRFEREARVLSRVVHPNVVAVHGYGRHGKHPYLVMEFVDGQSLADVMAQTGRLEPEMALAIASQVASGLAEAHGVGVVHRDIKPSNLLLRKLGSGALLVKVVDFGLARQVLPAVNERLTRVGDVFGTAGYMPPEQIRGDALDARADIYALAVVLYEMLTGSLPYCADSAMAMLIRQVTESPRMLRTWPECATLPVQLEQALAAGMNRDQEQRPTSALAFAQLLHSSMGSPAALPPGPCCCALCAAPLPGNASFCPSCGAVAKAESCPACGAAREGDRLACVECDTSLLASPRAAMAAMAAQIPGAGLEVWASVLILRSFGSSSANRSWIDGVQAIIAAVERQGGRVSATLANDVVAWFVHGDLGETRVQSAIDAGLALLRDLPVVQGSPWSAAVESGGLATMGGGVAWGLSWITGSAIEDGRRVLEAAQAGEILLGLRAHDEVRGRYDCDTAAAGFRKVIRRKDMPLHLASPEVRGVGVPLRARATDVAHLWDAAEQVRRQRKILVVPLVGPTGAGKTLIISEFVRKLEDGRDLWFIDAGRCTSLSRVAPYEPFSEMLKNRLRLRETTNQAEVLERVATLMGINELVTGAATETARYDRTSERLRAATVARLFGLQVAGASSTWGTTGTPDEQIASFNTYAEHIVCMAAKHPMVIVVEGVELASPPARSLLGRVIRHCTSSPVLLVLSLRPESADAVLAEIGLPLSRTRSLAVQPLDEEETATMLASWLGAVGRDPSLVRALHDVSEGRISRLEEAVFTLVEVGTLAATPDGNWHLVGKQTLKETLSRSFDSMLERRVARLDKSARDILAALAVSGSAAPRSFVAAIVGHGVHERDLAAVSRLGLVRDCVSPFGSESRAVELTWQHVGVTLLASLGEATVHQMHARAATWLTTARGLVDAERAALLAVHWRNAGNLVVGCQYLLDAADLSMHGHAHGEAKRMYLECMDLLAHSDSSADAVWFRAASSLAEKYYSDGDHDEALALLQVADARGAQSSAVSAEDAEFRCRIACVRAEVVLSRGDIDEAIVQFQSAAELILPWKGSLALYAMARAAMTFAKSGRAVQAEFVAKSALARGERLRSDAYRDRALGSLYGTLGHVATLRKEYSQAVQHYTLAWQHRAAAGDAVGSAMAQLSIGAVSVVAGEIEVAVHACRAAAADLRVLGHVPGLAQALANLGNALLEAGQPQEALVVLREAEGIFRRTRSANLAEVLRLLAAANTALGNGQDAADCTAEEAIWAPRPRMPSRSDLPAMPKSLKVPRD